MMGTKKEKSNRATRDNKSVLTGKGTTNRQKEEEFAKSKLRNKGKGGNANLGGSFSDSRGKKKLL